MGRNRSFLFSTGSASLDTSYTAMAVAGDASLGDSFLSLLTLRLTGIASATEVDWFLTADATGDHPITPVTTTAIVAGQTANAGGLGAVLGFAYTDKMASAAGGLWLWAQLDAGTATATAYIVCEVTA